MKTPNRLGKGTNYLSPHYEISFKIPQLYKSKETYFKTVSIEIFRSDLNGIRKRIRIWDNITTEKADIILSLYTQQRSKDPITGLLLDTNSFECHRKNPKGKYVFKNCILVNTITHHIIHGRLDNMHRFCKLINLNKKRREKLIRPLEYGSWYLIDNVTFNETVERRMRRKFHVRCEWGEKMEIASKSYLSICMCTVNIRKRPLCHETSVLKGSGISLEFFPYFLGLMPKSKAIWEFVSFSA